MKQTLTFNLNGESVQMEIEPHLTLLQLLRDKLELTGTKEGCGMGECGACTVLLDGKTVNSCIFPAMEVDGKSVTTIEGLTDAKGNLHPIQKAFIEYGAIQCGFCTRGWCFLSKPSWMRIQNQRRKRFEMGLPETYAAAPVISRSFRPLKQRVVNYKNEAPNYKHQIPNKSQ